MKIFAAMLGAVAALAFAGAANAATTLTFEGVGNLNAVGNFYASEGFVFSPNALAVVDTDAGGSGNFANEPSASTIVFFLEGSSAIVNATNGFTSGLSFFYSSSVAATVNVYDGLDGTGNLLASLPITAQFGGNECSGDPTGAFCNFTKVSTLFAGVARSVDFGGVINQTGFDNITFGVAGGTGAVPEAATWAMLIAGFGLVGAMARRRRIAAA